MSNQLPTSQPEAGPNKAFTFQGDEDLHFLRDELYEGSWDRMLADLRKRLLSGILQHKFKENIKADIAAIERITKAEVTKVVKKK